jgi:hypothetical protein
LGGYDGSRYIKNTLSPWIGMSSIDNGGLALRLSNIRLTSPLIPEDDYWGVPNNSHLVVLDSSTPFLMLPYNACVAFEKAFGLVWDETSQLYLVSEDHFQKITQSASPMVSFKIGDSKAPSVDKDQYYSMVRENLFLNASIPFLNSSEPKRYFPLKRLPSGDTDQPWVLGRAFMQNLYITASYDQRVFRLAAAHYDKNVTPRINSLDVQASNTSNTSDSGLLKGSVSNNILIIVLTVVGAVIVLFLVSIGYLCIWTSGRVRIPTKWRSKKKDEEQLSISNESSTTSGFAIPSDPAELAGTKIPELNSNEILEAANTSTTGELFGDPKTAELQGSLMMEAELAGDTTAVHEMDTNLSTRGGTSRDSSEL